MNKQITVVFEDKEYVLEFTRKTIAEMEKKGFLLADISNKPMTSIPALFAGAFLSKHRFVKQDTINGIFDNMTRKNELLEKLVEMYSEPILALVEETEGSAGNAKGTAIWE